MPFLVEILLYFALVPLKLFDVVTIVFNLSGMHLLYHILILERYMTLNETSSFYFVILSAYIIFLSISIDVFSH